MSVRDFKQALHESAESVFKAAQWLQRTYGCTVRINPPPRDHSTGQEVYERDMGDIIASFERVVEVKHRKNLTFTCAEDFPFDDIMIASVEPTDTHQIHMWVFLNKDMTHAIIVKGKEKKNFIKKDVYCWNTKKYELKYLCPKEHVQFVQISNNSS
jgi:hypothetical protein